MQKPVIWEFCGEKYIFDVFKEAYFAFLQISVISGRVLGNRFFIISSFEIFVFYRPFTCYIMHMGKLPLHKCGSFWKCMNYSWAYLEFSSNLSIMLLDKVNCIFCVMVKFRKVQDWPCFQTWKNQALSHAQVVLSVWCMVPLILAVFSPLITNFTWWLENWDF